jgi:hypothetical protein
MERRKEEWIERSLLRNWQKNLSMTAGLLRK